MRWHFHCNPSLTTQVVSPSSPHPELRPRTDYWMASRFWEVKWIGFSSVHFAHTWSSICHSNPFCTIKTNKNRASQKVQPGVLFMSYLLHVHNPIEIQDPQISTGISPGNTNLVVQSQKKDQIPLSLLLFLGAVLSLLITRRIWWMAEGMRSPNRTHFGQSASEYNNLLVRPEWLMDPS